MIEHVSFTVSPADADACAGFYELLGFERVTPPANLGERSIWLTRGASSLHLVFSGENGEQLATVPRGADGGHLALVVDNYAATLAALESAGVAIEPRAAHWGAPRAYTHDPAGNALELMAAAPPRTR